MRQQTRVIVFDKGQYDDEWPPSEAAGCVAWFAEKLAAIPATYRETAKIEINSVSNFDDSHFARIGIFYIRPETDEEMNSRMARERRRHDAQMAEERQILASLKAKYES